ncbi:MAG: single-stranded-DNA-specific exonuclease RecJ [Candidatus Omnitrophica bacterium]|nr:single-stranded-DNA-specific exonuclease RecJ [Candidatus Omnitrophota bacterium]
MQKIWRILQPDSDKVSRLTKSLGISPLLAQLLINRKIDSPDEAYAFLNPSFADLYDPFLFKDMGKTVSRIKKAIEKKENILIYGDYDVDGITGTAILIKLLREYGGRVFYYIPHRIEEGYGISEEGINYAVDKNINLVITVDCGITNASEVASLAKRGIDVVITDHHEPEERNLPIQAFAIVNPLCQGETYPDKNLSGVGVVFKLAQALLDKDGFLEIKKLLDLVCLGTIADISPLLGENRILVRYGLLQLNESQLPGVKALMEVSAIENKKISPYDISFILGPRINAMGRLDSAEASLKLFITESLSEALEIAKVLDNTNRKRQGIEEDIYNEAVSRIEREVNFKEDFSIVLGDERWHQGVVGIVASKLSQRYSRPVILFSFKDSIASGSGRVDLEDIHLIKVLDRCAHLFISYGGHKSACGIKMERDLIPQFKLLFNQLLKETITSEIFSTSLYIDGELPFSLLNSDLINDFNQLAPFGEGNPVPVFVSYGLRLKDMLNNRNRNRLEIWVTDGSFTYQARGRDFENWISQAEKGKSFDLAYIPRLLSFRGQEYISLNIEDFRSAL